MELFYDDAAAAPAYWRQFDSWGNIEIRRKVFYDKLKEFRTNSSSYSLKIFHATLLQRLNRLYRIVEDDGVPEQWHRLTTYILYALRPLSSSNFAAMRWYNEQLYIRVFGFVIDVVLSTLAELTNPSHLTPEAGPLDAFFDSLRSKPIWPLYPPRIFEVTGKKLYSTLQHYLYPETAPKGEIQTRFEELKAINVSGGFGFTSANLHMLLVLLQDSKLTKEMYDEFYTPGYFGDVELKTTDYPFAVLYQTVVRNTIEGGISSIAYDSSLTKASISDRVMVTIPESEIIFWRDNLLRFGETVGVPALKVVDTIEDGAAATKTFVKESVEATTETIKSGARTAMTIATVGIPAAAGVALIFTVASRQ